jgi:ankyrin repeat protein
MSSHGEDRKEGDRSDVNDLVQILHRATLENARDLEQQRLESSLRLANRLSERRKGKQLISREILNKLSFNVSRYILSDEHDSSMSRILQYAAVEGTRIDIEIILSLGAVVNKRNHDGCSALWTAAWKGNADTVDTLCKCGADINSPDNDGWTPLYVAASSDRGDVVAILLSHGADIYTREHDGRTPLYIAALMGHLDIVRMLFEAGADPDMCDKSDWSPVWIAARYGQVVSMFPALMASHIHYNISFYHT